MSPTRRRLSKSAPSADDYEDRDDDKDYEEPKRSRRERDEDEEEERPTRRRRSSARDEEEDEPRSRRSSRDDDDDEEEERPRRRSRSRDDDEEDEKPRRRRSRDEDEDEPRGRRRSRGRDDDDEEEEKPKRRSMKGGWGTADRAKDSNSDWASEVKLSSDEQVFKFLDDAPFVVYREHWIDERKGKKSFVCLNDPDVKPKPGTCPLCDIGDKGRIKSAFNVLLLEQDADPVLQVLVCGPTLTSQLKDKNDGKNGPLTEMYWGLSRSGKGSSTSYGMIPIKERDLVDDWDVEPLDDADIDELAEDAYTSKTFPENPPSLRALKEIAAEIEE
jgi:hypothetical protein